jgi:methylglyoxal synthase
MVQFCIAYCGVLSAHNLSATATTGKMVAEATGLDINLHLTAAAGGVQQICARIIYNEIDLVMFFADPAGNDNHASLIEIARLCDQYNIPFAANTATAEVLIQGLRRGDFDWRDIVNPKSK